MLQKIRVGALAFCLGVLFGIAMMLAGALHVERAGAGLYDAEILLSGWKFQAIMFSIWPAVGVLAILVASVPELWRKYCAYKFLREISRLPMEGQYDGQSWDRD